ncbi:MAG: DUF190 domain-containing protein [Caldimicrobium sp.]|nr:DUF190 domain-containing protein [Caldimicrobium sp.]
MLRIYVREQDRLEGKPLYKRIIELAKERDMAGVTVYRAITGYGPSKIIRTLSFADLSSNLPLVIELVDSEEKVKNFVALIKEKIQHGLIIIQEVFIIKNVP